MAGLGTGVADPRSQDRAAWDALDSLEDVLHARTADWPGVHPGGVDARSGWETLGRPNLLVVASPARGDDPRAVHRAWVRADGLVGHDSAQLPGGGMVASEGTGLAADLLQWSAALLPPDLMRAVFDGGIHDDLVVIASEDLRSLPWPLLPVIDHQAGEGRWERLAAHAAVSLLPSLGWGVHLVQRQASCGSPAGASVQAYLDPEANLDGVRDLLARRSGAGNAAALPCLAARLALRRSGTALVATHGTFTTDGSVDLRDHLGAVIPPELLCTWRLPPVTILTGCRTGTSNAGAPLHLAEAALVAGANHVIAVTHRTTDEIMDVVLAAVLRRLGASTAASGSQAGSLSPAQAVQSALQQVHRAYPIPATDPTPWSVVHVGPPACADGGTPF